MASILQGKLVVPVSVHSLLSGFSKLLQHPDPCRTLFHLSSNRLQSVPPVLLSKQLFAEHQFRKILWKVLTGDSKLQMVQHEMLRAEACSQNSTTYNAPIQPWIMDLQGRSLVFRTCRPDMAPDLVSALIFMSAALHLFATHTDVAGGSEESEDLDEGEQVEFENDPEAAMPKPLAMQDAEALVMQLSQQDPSGPWNQDIPLTTMMRVFPAIIKRIHVFAPVRLLMAFNITVG